MYSLVSPTVIGYDLCRLPGGAEVAGVLRQALSLGPADLPPLLASTRDRDPEARVVARSAALDAASLVVRTSDALEAAAAGLADAPRRRVALGMLERASIGNVEALVRLVRHDVLDWTLTAADDSTGPAVEVVVDAAVAAYTAGVLAEDAAERLWQPWRDALPALPAPADDPGPRRDRVEALLGRAARLAPRDVERLQVVNDAVRPSSGGPAHAVDWAPAMHSATWAAHLADRLRPAAVAQLRLVEALHGRVPTDRLAQGVWSALSGAVQAEVVGDLLDAEEFDVLAGGTLLALELPA